MNDTPKMFLELIAKIVLHHQWARPLAHLASYPGRASKTQVVSLSFPNFHDHWTSGFDICFPMTCGLGVAARRLFCFFRDGLDGAPAHSTGGKATDQMEVFDGTGLGYLCCHHVRQVLCCPHVRQVAHPKC